MFLRLKWEELEGYGVNNTGNIVMPSANWKSSWNYDNRVQLIVDSYCVQIELIY